MFGLAVDEDSRDEYSEREIQRRGKVAHVHPSLCLCAPRLSPHVDMPTFTVVLCSRSPSLYARADREDVVLQRCCARPQSQVQSQEPMPPSPIAAYKRRAQYQEPVPPLPIPALLMPRSKARFPCLSKFSCLHSKFIQPPIKCSISFLRCPSPPRAPLAHYQTEDAKPTSTDAPTILQKQENEKMVLPLPRLPPPGSRQRWSNQPQVMKTRVGKKVGGDSCIHTQIKAIHQPRAVPPDAAATLHTRRSGKGVSSRT